MAQEIEFRLRIEGPDIDREIPLRRRKISLVSPQHAELENDGRQCWLRDLNSPDGTKHNGQPIEPQTRVPLSHGDVIEIGPYRITFSQIPAPAAQEEESPATSEEAHQTPPPALEEEEEVVEQALDRIDGGDSPPPPPSTWLIDWLPPQPPHDLAPYGLSIYGRKLLRYLPDIYHPPTLKEPEPFQWPSPDTFIPRFLGVIEAILTPIEWNIDNFDLFLNPGTAPTGFLPWLEQWFELTYEPSWDEARRRELLKQAHWLFTWQGTKKGMSKLLEIYAGVEPEILEHDSDEMADIFVVILRLPDNHKAEEKIVTRLIENYKPAHTRYELRLSKMVETPPVE